LPGKELSQENGPRTKGVNQYWKQKGHCDPGNGRIVKMDEKEWQSLEDFTDWLRDNQEDIPPEYVKVVDEHFWELGEDRQDGQRRA